MTSKLLYKLDRINRINLVQSFRLIQRMPIRLFSTKDDDENDKRISEKASKEEVVPKGKSAIARDNLKNLLLSIPKVKKDSSDDPKEQKVLNYKLAVPERISRKQREKERAEREEMENKGPKLSEEFLKAVKNVAASIEGDPSVTESELIQKLKSQTVGPKINMSDLFTGMIVDKKKSPPKGDAEGSRAERVRHILQDSGNRDQRQRRSMDGSHSRDSNSRRQEQTYKKIDLFNDKPLGIFTKRETSQESLSHLHVWDKLDQKEMELSATHPPANGFEEMILWTKKGKLWKFPINNEDGMDEEKNTSFQEHVFLEPKIDVWCPKKGPIRQFMELVCVGLSRNPFWTAKEKDNILNWYREFFKGKQAILTDLGIGQIK